MSKKNKLPTSAYPMPDGHPTLHRPRRNYWGNLYDEDIYREEENKPRYYDHSDYDPEDDHSYYYDNENYE